MKSVAPLKGGRFSRTTILALKKEKHHEKDTFICTCIDDADECDRTIHGVCGYYAEHGLNICYRYV